MEVGLTSVAATTQVSSSATLMAKLFGVEEPELEDVLEQGSDEAAGRNEPLTVTKIAEELNNARGGLGLRPSADAVRSQQLVAGVSFEQTRITAARVSIDDDSIEIEFAQVEHTRVTAFVAASSQTQPKETDPLLVDLDGDGFETTGVGGARFDLDGDGMLDSASVAAGGDALLAMDRNGNGRIDDGTELFGDHHGAADGIAELARLDDNGDGRIDAADAAFDRLRLFSNGSTQTLAEAGISAFELARNAYTGTATGGDRLVDTIEVVRSDGTSTLAADAMLQHV